MRVAGVDGYTKGWVSVALRDGAFEVARLHGDFAAVLVAHRDAKVIAVDIPIGLPCNCEVRAADDAARAFLGGRSSSVFPVPPRPVLQASTYAAARKLAVSYWGRSLSAQSFALAKKIIEVDAHSAERRLFEVHPEVSFRALKGAPLSGRKKSWNGAQERRVLLQGAGISLPDHVEGVGDAALDDLLDAAAAAWSAHRIATGTARCLPDPPERIGERETAIWY
jgi:predicted RNase H-like nuclease